MVIKTYKSYCCLCGKVLGQGCKDNLKKGYGTQSKRRFHKTCNDKINQDFEMFIEIGNTNNKYDWAKHYKYENIAFKKTPTNEITSQEEYNKHLNAKMYYSIKRNENK